MKIFQPKGFGGALRSALKLKTRPPGSARMKSLPLFTSPLSRVGLMQERSPALAMLVDDATAIATANVRVNIDAPEVGRDTSRMRYIVGARASCLLLLNRRALKLRKSRQY